jgi:hypothetical protein
MLKFTASIPLDDVGGPPISWPVSRSRAVGSGGPCIILFKQKSKVVPVLNWLSTTSSRRIGKWMH